MSFTPSERNKSLSLALNKWEAILQDNTRIIEALKKAMNKS